MKLMVYSHDAFGLGNIRRMLAICQYLLQVFPNVSILVVSGSPALHSLRLPTGLDYIKLPCMGRDEAGELAVRYLEGKVEDTVKLRSDLILTVTMNFQPDLFLVDKKPDGLQGELKSTLKFLKAHLPQTKLVLLLRDILDRPEVTIAQWQRHDYYRTLETLYDQAWVVGTPEVFDLCREYQFPDAITRKTRFCSYILREPGLKSRSQFRQELGIESDESLVLVTPGGGGDGYRLVDMYLQGLATLSPGQKLKSVIIFGPEMSASQGAEILQRTANHPSIRVEEFTDDLMSYMDAADIVVSMGGYNTIGEILTLRKKAIVIPRTQPVLEQWIRAQRMAKLGAFKTICPDILTPELLMEAIDHELHCHQTTPLQPGLEMNALPRIAQLLTELLYGSSQAPAYSSLNFPTFTLEVSVT
jgi:predicted glycosyltransferase